jgi:hypothetical protein
MPTKKLRPIYLGDILLREFMQPLTRLHNFGRTCRPSTIWRSRIVRPESRWSGEFSR